VRSVMCQGASATKWGLTTRAFLGLCLCHFHIELTVAQVPENNYFRAWVDMRDQGIVKQSLDYSCGPAALATLLSYYFQIPTSEQEILNVLESQSALWQLPADWRETGVSMAALAKMGNYKGLEAVGVAIELGMLSRLKIPAIAYLEHRGLPHFSVIRGVDGLGNIQLADPTWGNQLLSQREFAKLWPVGETGKGKLLLLRPKRNSKIAVDSSYFSISSRTPTLRNIN
jgi:predicted double-glycine peptidase